MSRAHGLDRASASVEDGRLTVALPDDGPDGEMTAAFRAFARE